MTTTTPTTNSKQHTTHITKYSFSDTNTA
jgi:hypothetical protein